MVGGLRVTLLEKADFSFPKHVSVANSFLGRGETLCLCAGISVRLELVQALCVLS